MDGEGTTSLEKDILDENIRKKHQEFLYKPGVGSE